VIGVVTGLVLVPPGQPRNSDTVQGGIQSGDVPLILKVEDLRGGNGKSSDSISILPDPETQWIGRSILGIEIVSSVELVAKKIKQLSLLDDKGTFGVPSIPV
jgi:hypothetical protein